MDIDKIVEQMPKAENKHNIIVEPETSFGKWARRHYNYGYINATFDQCRLLAEQGWRKVPSVEELAEELDRHHTHYTSLERAILLHRRLMEVEDGRDV